MDYQRVGTIGLLVTTLLPATVVFGFLAFVGFLFWMAGIAGFLMGSYSWNDILSSSRPDAMLLYISAPLGVFGMGTLWIIVIQIIRKASLKKHRLIAIGLACGVLSTLHMLFLNIVLAWLFVPTTVIAINHVYTAAKGSG